MIMKRYFIFFFIILLALVVVKTTSRSQNTVPETQTDSSHSELLPDREIKYKEEKSAPDWKKNWDFARELFREKKFSEALVQYEILFSQKMDIEEARWEYATILMLLKRWDNAKAELEKLLATDPSSIRYRLAMAKVCMENGDVNRSLELYDQLLNESLTEPDKKKALEGMVKAYELQGESAKSLIPLAELVTMAPDNNELQLKLATLYYDQGNIENAREICEKLRGLDSNDARVLSLLAEIEETQQNYEAAAAYWKRVVTLQPDNQKAHQNLYQYYLKNNDPAMSFKHLEQLIRISPDNIKYLQQAAELNIQLDRLDRALEYYEFALAIDPTNEQIIKDKRYAQRLLAHDILALIENDAGKKVWQDLSKITPDSIGVYREAANLLREQGKVTELIKVLQLLYKHLPEDQQIKSELSALLEQQGRIEELSTLQLADPSDVETESTN